MGTAAYDGVFLAPESIVIYPGLATFTLNQPINTDATDAGANDEVPHAAVFRPDGAAHEFV